MWYQLEVLGTLFVSVAGGFTADKPCGASIRWDVGWLWRLASGASGHVRHPLLKNRPVDS